MHRVPKRLSAWVSECPRDLRVAQCSSAWVPKCPSILCAWVPKCLSSARVPQVLECPSSALRVSLECPLSTLWVKKAYNITGTGLLNSFIEFLKTFSEYIFYIIPIFFCFLGNKMHKLYHFLLARYRYNHSKGFQKLTLNILWSFKKLNAMDSRALFLVKL